MRRTIGLLATLCFLVTASSPSALRAAGAPSPRGPWQGQPSSVSGGSGWVWTPQGGLTFIQTQDSQGSGQTESAPSLLTPSPQSLGSGASSQPAQQDSNPPASQQLPTSTPPSANNGNDEKTQQHAKSGHGDAQGHGNGQSGQNHDADPSGPHSRDHSRAGHGAHGGHDGVIHHAQGWHVGSLLAMHHGGWHGGNAGLHFHQGGWYGGNMRGQGWHGGGWHRAVHHGR